MKKLHLILLLILTIFLANCKEDISERNQVDIGISSLADLEIHNTIIADFAKAIALSTNELEFQNLLRHETNKQFDYDYDVLYRFIKDKEVKLESGSTLTVSELVYNNFESSKWSSMSKKDFDDILKILIITQNTHLLFELSKMETGRQAQELLVPEPAGERAMAMKDLCR